jgi:hypothetical protein
MRRKMFKFAAKKKHEPVILDIDGTEISCRPGIDGLTLMEFTKTVVEATSLEDDVAAGLITEMEATRRGVEAANAFVTLLKATILDEEWAKFETLVRENDVTLEVLSEIASWLVEVYSNRPTEPS